MKGVRLKLDRALEHLGTLDEEIKRFLATDPFNVEIRPPTKDVRKLFPAGFAPPFHFIRIRTTPPERVSVLLGDYVHNLRSALDHLIWQLSDRPDRITEFPICSQPSTKSARDILRKAHDIPADAWQEIIQVQPCYRTASFGDHPLWVIRCLDIIDKHREPLFAILGHSLIEDSGRVRRIVAVNPIPLHDGDPIYYAPAPTIITGTQLTDGRGAYSEPSYAVIVEAYPTSATTLPLANLGQLYHFVNCEVVPRFERFFNS